MLTSFDKIHNHSLHRLLVAPCPLCWLERNSLQHPTLMHVGSTFTIICNGNRSHRRLVTDGTKSPAEAIARWNTMFAAMVEFPIREPFPYPAGEARTETMIEDLLRQCNQGEITSKMAVQQEMLALRVVASLAKERRVRDHIPIVWNAMLITGWKRREFCHTAIDLSLVLRPVSLALSRVDFEGRDPSLPSLKYGGWGDYELLFDPSRAPSIFSKSICSRAEIGTLVQLRVLGLSWTTIEEALARPMQNLRAEEETWKCYKQLCSFLECNPHLAAEYAGNEPRNWLGFISEFAPKSFELWKTYKVLRDICDELDRKSNEEYVERTERCKKELELNATNCSSNNYDSKGVSVGRFVTFYKDPKESHIKMLEKFMGGQSPTGRIPSQPEFQDLPKDVEQEAKKVRIVPPDKDGVSERYKKVLEKISEPANQEPLKPMLKFNNNLFLRSDLKVDLTARMIKIADEAGIPVVGCRDTGPVFETDFKVGVKEWWEQYKAWHNQQKNPK